MITQDELKSQLYYNTTTGIFTRLVTIAKTVKVGDVTGYTNPRGYVEVCVNGHTYYAHRLAWLYVYGAWPNSSIDHINGIKHDNKLFNLRERLCRRRIWLT